MEDYKQNDLLMALENESNASIMNLNSRKINKHKNDILQQVIKDKDMLKSFHKKLKYYRYCSELSDLQDGHYIRWIPLKNPDNIKLTQLENEAIAMAEPEAVRQKLKTAKEYMTYTAKMQCGLC